MHALKCVASTISPTLGCLATCFAERRFLFFFMGNNLRYSAM
ncbi:hypothetical protein J562_4294, partial [Acinetobacter baumannii 1440750]